MKDITLRLLALSVLAILLFQNEAAAQNSFYAIKNGNWNAGTTWTLLPVSQGGSGAAVSACASGCVAGVDYPGANDDAYTEGWTILLPSASYSANNVYVAYNHANSLNKSLGTVNLTINGELAAYDPTIPDYAFPTTTVITTTATGFTLIFTGLNNANVIYPGGWNTTAPLRQVTFNPGAGNTLYLPDIAIANQGVLTVQTGTLEAGGVVQNAAGATTGTISVGTGATLFVNTGNIMGNSGSSSSFPTLSITGTLTSASSTTSFINASVLTLNSGATFNVGYNGANQTEGWWYQTNRPSTFNINAASTVGYNSSTNQNVYATTYGNLTLSSGTTATKSLAGANTLDVVGNLTNSSVSVTFNSNASTGIFIGGNLQSNGPWTPTDVVTFNGTTTQTISGSTAVNFSGGIDVSKTGTLMLNKAITVSNGIKVTTGTLDLGSQTVTLSSGNIDNSGTITPSSSTVLVNGITSVVGSATTTLNVVTVGSSGNLTGASGLTFNGTLTNSGTLTAPSGTMNIDGNFANSGTFNANSGTLAFGGASAQSVTGSGTLPLNNVSVSNSTGTVSINHPAVNLSGILTLTSSSVVFDADGSGSGVLTVKSTGVNVGGQIAALPQPANFSGNVTVERYINGPGDWRYLSMPITNGNAASWQANFPVTGSFSNPSAAGSNNVTSSSAASIYYYNASAATPAYVAVGSGGSTSSTSLSNTVGYSAYTYLSGSFTASVRGTIAAGTVNIPLGTGGTGYNLVPNPYPSTIDWDNITTTGLSSSMSIRTSNNVFAAYVKGGATTNPPFVGWTGEVATGQAFWVQSTGASTLGLNEASKSTNAFQFMRTAPLENLLRMTLISGDQRDEAVIWFPSGATDDVDTDFDAMKMKNGEFGSPVITAAYINISSRTALAGSPDFAINGVAALAGCSKSVLVTIDDITTTHNVIMFSNLSTFTVGYAITMVDHFLNKQVNVTDSLQYGFDVTTDPASFGSQRFELQFSPAKPTISVAGEVLTSSVAKGNQWLLNGVPIAGATGAQYNASKSGVYSVQVQSAAGCSLTSGGVTFVVTGIENGGHGDDVKAYPNPVKSKMQLELSRGFETIRIFDNLGRPVNTLAPSAVGDVNSFQLDFSNYPTGLYVIWVTDRSGSFPIKVIKD